MPETLSYQSVDGQPLNEIVFSRTIKNIPSKSTEIFLKSESETLTFYGEVRIVPTDGRSYSEDLSVSDIGQKWTKFLEIVVPPLEKAGIKLRVVPVSTPAKVTGRASIVITGTWE